MRITIKRRLIISNILTFIIPVLSALAMFSGTSILLFNDFDGFVVQSNELTSIPIHDDGVLISRSDAGQYVLYMSESVSRYFEKHMHPDSAYITLVVSNDAAPWTDERTNRLMLIVLFTIILALLLVAALVNRILTKFVFRPVMASIDVLADGVQEISAGNLNYKITQDMGNEFDLICTSFNQMATRLSNMVAQQQANEKNRKELIAGISHDLRTPLTAIQTYVEGMELGMATTPQKQEKYLATIKSKAKDIEHIISQLFLFSKLDIGEFPMHLKQKNVADWLTDFVSTVKDEYAQKGLAIEMEPPAPGVFFSVDSVQLRRVLTNILENSVKYGDKTNGRANITCTSDHESIRITLTDNGPGVPADNLGMLFDIFYRADRARSNTSQGSGLGLAISAKIIERMGGAIHAANAVNGGLSITMALPATRRQL